MVEHNHYNAISPTTESTIRLLSYNFHFGNLLSQLRSIDHKCLYFNCIADKLRKYHGEALLQQDIDGREKQAALHTDLTKYWATHQRVEDTRDADLKCGLKGAFRITIPEDKLGPASMTIFQVGT